MDPRPFSIAGSRITEGTSVVLFADSLARVGPLAAGCFMVSSDPFSWTVLHLPG